MFIILGYITDREEARKFQKSFEHNYEEIKKENIEHENKVKRERLSKERELDYLKRLRSALNLKNNKDKKKKENKNKEHVRVRI